jgi:23S rRNA pseudouridine1911/1915/1917 synthase
VKRTLRTSAAHRGRRLDDTLRAWLPEAAGRPFSKSLIRRLIIAGAVRADGRTLRRPAEALRPGLALEVTLDPTRLPKEAATPGAVAVLYEDAFLLAVDKPPGLPSVPGADPARPSLVGAVRAMLLGRGDSAYLGVHQRLDRDTSGVMLFAKDARANAGLAAAFAGRQARKLYHALVARPLRLPPRAWIVCTPIGGKQASTEFARIRVLARGLLVEARPGTGRKHQVRLHLAERGWPILGDDRYGAGRPGLRLMLHAASLALPHPITGAPLRIESPWPEDFRLALAALERG